MTKARKSNSPANLKAAVLERDGQVCQACGSTDDLQSHHVKPLHLNGDEALENRVTLCGKCHRAQHKHDHATIAAASRRYVPPGFVEWLRQQELSSHTEQAYRMDVGLFGVWFEQTNGVKLEGAFTPTDLREYKERLLSQGRAGPATIQRKLASIRALGRYLVESGQADDNPARYARGPKSKRHVPKWLDRKELARLMRELEKAVAGARTTPAKAQAVRNLAIVTTLVQTGLRVSELCALNVEDLTVRERSGWLVVRHGKGNQQREVPLNVTVRRALSDWLEVSQPQPGAAVFTGQRGRLTPRGIQLMLEEVGQRAMVELGPHALRHTFAKNLRNAGVDIEKVALLMGHSSIETTAIYTVPDGRDLARAVETLED